MQEIVNTGDVNLRSLVAKANSLVHIMSSYNLQQLRLIAYCIACYDSRTIENKKFSIKVSDIAAIFEMDDECSNRVIKKVVETASKAVCFKTDEYKKYIYWFSEFVYIKNKAEVEFTLNESIIPFVLGLKERFSIYRIKDVHQFKSSNTWHLYENLNQWKNAGIWNVSIEHLRKLLSKESKYNRFNSFREFCIDAPIQEINEKSNLFVEYQTIKKGKVVTAIQFIINKKDDSMDNDNRLFIMLLKCKINRKVAWKISNKILEYGYEEYFINKIIEVKKRYSSSKGSLQQYITGAINSEFQNILNQFNPYDLMNDDEVMTNDISSDDDNIDYAEVAEKEKVIFDSFVEDIKNNNKYLYDYYLNHGRNNELQNVYLIYLEDYLKRHPEVNTPPA